MYLNEKSPTMLHLRRALPEKLKPPDKNEEIVLPRLARVWSYLVA